MAASSHRLVERQPRSPELADVRDQDHVVQHGHAGQGDEARWRPRSRTACPRSHRAKMPPDPGERHAGEHPERRPRTLPVGEVQQDEDEHERERHDDQQARSAPAPGCSNCPPQSQRSSRPGGSVHLAPPPCACASATKLPRSRPRTLPVTVIRRWPHSRVIVDGPSTPRMSASRASGMRSPLGAAHQHRADRLRVARGSSSGRRTTSGKRSWPSTTSPTRLRPDATRPGRAPPGRARRSGRSRPVDRRPAAPAGPVICSTATSAAPGMARSTASISRAFACSTSKSSPKSLTPTSLRTPAIISLMRSSIGWSERHALARHVARAPSRSAATSSSCVAARFHSLARLERDEHVGQLEPHRVGRDLRGADPAPDVLDLVGNCVEERLLHLRVP